MLAWVIETSTERGLLALIEDGKVRFAKELPFGYNQSKHLMPELQQAYQTLQIDSKKLSCIGVGIGPGSYTGIRIGVAVAKTLAYAWQVPLVGFCSLEAFIPSEPNTAFAALIDAKIGGAYVLKGVTHKENVQYTSTPHVCPLEQLGSQLEDVQVLVTPYSKNLKNKMDQIYPTAAWTWSEVAPSAKHIGALVYAKYQRGEMSHNGHLELLYLRKTEAERQREQGEKSQ